MFRKIFGFLIKNHKDRKNEKEKRETDKIKFREHGNKIKF